MLMMLRLRRGLVMSGSFVVGIWDFEVKSKGGLMFPVMMDD